MQDERRVRSKHMLNLIRKNLVIDAVDIMFTDTSAEHLHEKYKHAKNQTPSKSRFGQPKTPKQKPIRHRTTN